MKFRVCFLVLLASLSISLAFAEENISGGNKVQGKRPLRTAASCLPSSSSASLDINNVRCLLHNGGDMWWDLVGDPRYEVPKVDNPSARRYSSFAASLWIGGLDASGQLRVAAQTYRQDGNDFWAGPLTLNGASTEQSTCQKWDKHYKINKAEIDLFRGDFAAGNVDFTKYPIIQNWPWQGDAGQDAYMAPFVDVDNDLVYNPNNGDYPKIFGDQAIWWVINDKGDVHTSTSGEAIGIEIQMMAFAFSTANSVNDMTFYDQKVFNRSSNTLYDTYIGQWVDSDVGFFQDDWVGCDTTRGLGIAYNGDADDQGSTGYGLNPPAFGVDFFQGPVGDDGNRLDMKKFVYYNNDFSLIGNPEKATHFYNYLIGRWKDGSVMVDNGKNGFAQTAPGPETNYMFYGFDQMGSCSYYPNSGWSEASSNNPPGDRRFIESAGPFTLQPGAENEIIIGALWARGYYNSQFGSVCELLRADDIAQALFDNNFKLLTGPDAPRLAIEEYDQELMISWFNEKISNNSNENYTQVDPILAVAGVADSIFAFQGYMLFQLASNSVTSSELFDTDKARLVAQCDIKDGVSTIVNRSVTLVSGSPDPVITDEIMVQGGDDGIFTSVRVTEDLFASGSDRRLVNYKDYYYGIIAYAYNDTSSDGRKFVPGNSGFLNTSAIPHKIDFESFGTTINSAYGLAPSITRKSGFGNGGNETFVTKETENSILISNFSQDLVFESGFGPVSMKVTNPKEVKASDYRLVVTFDSLTGVTSDTTFSPVKRDSTFAEWVLYEKSGNNWNAIYTAEYKKSNYDSVPRPTPLVGSEKVIRGHGFSISLKQVEAPGNTNNTEYNNGFISSSSTYSVANKAWLGGLRDQDGTSFNWILSGTNQTTAPFDNASNTYINAGLYDPEEDFENIINGTWAPYGMTKSYSFISNEWGVRLTTQQLTPAEMVNVKLANLPDVDIVFTSDKSKWSRCVVVETQPNKSLARGYNGEAGAHTFLARWDYSRDINGNPENASLPLDASTQGMSWFPGYAINVSTGERLNIFFGENSWYQTDNGNDMIFNPTSSIGSDNLSFGGGHFVYVHNSRYNGCDSIAAILRQTNRTITNLGQGNLGTGPSGPYLKDIYKNMLYAGIPMLNSGYNFTTPSAIPSDVKISIRVSRPYAKNPAVTGLQPVFDFSMKSMAANLNNTSVAKDAMMNLVRIVPNPYYAFSKYETSQLQNIVKFTNLPKKCKIRIYTLNGTLIRTFNKESDEPFQNWDLKNRDGVPVASGIYIIHIDGFDLGEKILKFFAVMPQIDLNSY